ncbi:MAG: GGDEF domain-containing protein [Rhodospirillales bacterium]|nr:GGDEF domain-containing protein [Rhodospirillales bacterium]
MEYNQSPEKASECAHLALSLMEERGISPQPKNFTLWYAYFAGSNPDLTHALNMLLDQNIAFSVDRNADLFNQFCAGTEYPAALSLMAEQVETELEAVLGVLQNAGAGAKRYGRSLETASGELARSQHAGAMGQIVHRLLNETRAMVQQNRALEVRVRESSAQIKTLRDELESSRKHSLFDPLTELANRKLFDTSLKNAMEQSKDTGKPVSLLFVDVDHFKLFNDTHGHQIGDQVLKLLAKIMQHCIRDLDTAARYGGEEFAVILPQTGLGGALEVARRIRDQIANKPLVHRRTGEKLGQITVSIGVSQMKPGESQRDFVERADQALYAAKRTGRNKVVTEETLQDKMDLAS